MNWNFRLGGKEVSYTILENMVAIKPEPQLTEFVTRAALVEWFGRPPDVSLVRDIDNAVSLPHREVFARAGWIFVDAHEPVARAAEMRLSLSGAQATAPVLVSSSGELMVGTDLVTVQLSEKLSEGEALAQLVKDGLILVRRLGIAENTFEVRLPSGPSLSQTISNLQERSDIYRFAEPELLQIIAGRFTPTDPHFDRQWQHRNDGSNGGLANADIHSERAWDLTRGIGIMRPARLAVIDNGMEITHPDLRNGIVGGGYFAPDGVGGATFVRLNGAPNFPAGNHGTFCMGMAGARMNNNLGGCGSAPEADLLAVACLPDQVGTQTTLARAVAYAADPTREDSQASASHGADVISCSLGPATDWDMTSVLDLAIRFANTNGRGGIGCPIFWATSNSAVDVARDEVCSHPDVIAVGRSNRNDHQDGSAFGPKLEFLAPGRDVYSTVSGGAFDFGTGTSYATPLSAGVGALVLSRYPNWTPQQVRQRLIQSCDKVGEVVYDANGHHDQYGFGRLNAEQAVQ
ncbi:MAG TPA: S8 family serine peptidase [Pyrinomonadaceae bacterium]|nr:S8 family serine peptidase [Pyrinomonadaceae bacterium]